MEWRAYGPRAALIRFGGGADRARAVSAALEGIDSGATFQVASSSKLEACSTICEFTVAFDQVLVEFADGVDVAEATGELIEWFESLTPVRNDGARVHRIGVRYDGEDLAEVAARAGLSEAEVVRIHAATVYDVAMLGFSPGFPYLTGLDARLVTPRRSEPRTHVRAGAVAVGGKHTGIYSVASPGGWNVIGHTEVRLFDPEHESFLFQTGDRVEFVPNHGS